MAASKVVECVPNFSEGRKDATVQAIASAIRDTVGCSLQDVDPGTSTNRTVYTFFGPPGAVVEGALSAARVARRLIDMTQQTGELEITCTSRNKSWDVHPPNEDGCPKFCSYETPMHTIIGSP